MKFRIYAVIRLLLLIATAFAFIHLYTKTKLIMVTILAGIFIVYQIVRFIHFVEKTNRDLNRFFQSIKNDDFTQTFSATGLGPSFDELRKSFNQVTQQFIRLRSEKEENFRYLQTVIQHVGTGLLSFNLKGEVLLLNNTAKRLLNVARLRNINSLKETHEALVRKLLKMKSGERTLFKIEGDGPTLHLSINATEFKLKGDHYTLVSLQDIRNEIEMEHMAKELEIAWQVQSSLLPGTSPSIPGYDIAGMCMPAREVGGDYFDFIPMDGKIFLVIGDVSGKGIPAAIYMTLTKGFIQSHIREESSPAEILIRVNDLMYRTLKKQSFVTMFIAVLDWEKNRVTCARAGHNPAIVFPKEGKHRFVKPSGIALGIRRRKEFEQSIDEYEFDLDQEDWLILYTDGFTEAMNADLQEFGDSRLLEIIRTNLAQDAQNLVDNLITRVDEFVGDKHQHDDMTIIALKRAAVP